MMRSVFLFLFLATFILILGCAGQPPKAAVEYNPIIGVEIIGVVGPDIGAEKPLNSPRDIAINQLKEIYIADYGNDRIVKLDSNYVFMGEFGGYGVTLRSLSGPLAVALDNVSNLYFIDSGNARVIRVDRRLNLISSENSFNRGQTIPFDRPTSIKVTRRGDIYIGDYGLGACYKLDPFFNYVYDFGTISSAVAIGYPSGMEIDKDDKVYVADSQNGKIQMFDSFGMSLGYCGDGILNKPVAVAVSTNLDIWVADSGNRTLFCFDARGRQKFSWGGQGQYQLLQPTGLFITKDNIIYLVDSAAGKVFVLKPISGK